MKAQALKTPPPKADKPKPVEKEKTSWQNIDPEMAEFYLNFNADHQRPLLEKHVAFLAKEMSAGRWRVNGDTIRIDKEGRLIDGQHRLRAVLKSGATIRVLVVENLEPDSFVTIDTGGKSRSHADVLSIKGETQTKALMGALTAVYRYDRKDYPAMSLKPSTQELIELLDRTPELRESLNFSHGKRTRFMRSAVGTLTCHYPRLSDFDTWQAFWSALQDGANIEPGTGVHRLRERLIKMRTQSAKLSTPDLLALSIKAWNSTMCGRKIQALSFRNDEAFPRFI